MKAIGPSFAAELGAAGLLGLSFSWTESGNLFFGDDITPDQRAAISGIYEAHNPASPNPPFVPQAVTKYQCCVVLARHGLLTQTNAYFEALPADDPRRLAWLMAATVQRHSESTLDAVAHLGISEAEADAMFIEAVQVE